MTDTFMGVGAPASDDDVVVLARPWPRSTPIAIRMPRTARAPSAPLPAGWRVSSATTTSTSTPRSRRGCALVGDARRRQHRARRCRGQSTPHHQRPSAPCVDGGAMPVLLGGDDSVAEPFVGGWRDHGPITVVHIDAHLDFRDEVSGRVTRLQQPHAPRQRDGLGAADHPHGAARRRLGSARGRAGHLEAGNVIVRARELAHEGPQAVARRLVEGERFVIVYDVDGTDPADIPAVRAPVAGRSRCRRGGRPLRGTCRSWLARGAGGHGVRADARSGRAVSPGARARAQPSPRWPAAASASVILGRQVPYSRGPCAPAPRHRPSGSMSSSTES